MYDPDRFDAEILLDRMGLSAPFTIEDMGIILKRARSTIENAAARGWIPKPAFPGSAPERRAALWTQEQVLDIMTSDYYLQPPIPIEHGTAKGYGQHRRAGTPKCDPCKRAYNKDRGRKRGPRGKSPFRLRGPRQPKVSA